MVAVLEPVDLNQRRSDVGDLSLGFTWSQILQALAGQPFLFARGVYNNELTLHFGTEIPAPAPRIPGPKPLLRSRGSYILRLLSSRWILVGSDNKGFLCLPEVSEGVPAESVSIERLEKEIPLSKGATLLSFAFAVDAEAHREGVYSLFFSDGSRLSITASRTSRESGVEGEPDWDILLPGSQRLLVGPGMSCRLVA